MKKFLFGLVLGLLLAGSVTALAATDFGIKLVINGQDITATMDVPPQMIEGRTMVPARYVAEALGASVEWDATTRSMFISSNDEAAPDSTTAGKIYAKEGTTPPPPTGTWVWRANNSTKFYHSSNLCSNMASPYDLLIEKALELNLAPCSKCWSF